MMNPKWTNNDVAFVTFKNMLYTTFSKLEYVSHQKGFTDAVYRLVRLFLTQESAIFFLERKQVLAKNTDA